MDIWQPEADETLLSRTLVSFATGAATPVRGMRWFRDTERGDIQHELPSWPEGPTFTPRSTGESLARNFGKGGATALGGIFMAALSAAGGNISRGSGARSGTDTPDDPADEVKDFPVVWAAPGTVARTLPWQLDPARSPEKHYRTHAIVTDRRLVIVGFPYSKRNDELIEDEALWEIPRSLISRIEPKPFKDGNDVKVVFSDDSWCRLRAVPSEKFTRYLLHPLDLVPWSALVPAQQSTVEQFVATDVEPNHGAPFVTRRPCGHYRVELLSPSEVDSFFGLSENPLLMDAEGNEVELKDYHPDDF
ncbi:hypothetical protein ABZ921_08450 [Streptomyces atriruber]|uniref:Uncharacterized protein n=1 Tax=Streptomyces atriruber TaxID=545121 RepID=A0ABV3BI19_9ACTN